MTSNDNDTPGTRTSSLHRIAESLEAFEPGHIEQSVRMLSGSLSEISGNLQRICMALDGADGPYAALVLPEEEYK